MTHISVEGGCLCGAIRYKVDGEVLGSAACHCRDCQYVCGGAPSYVFVVPSNAIDITKGETSTYRSEADSGAKRVRHFCGNCGTPLFAEDSAYPKFMSIKAGTLDDPSHFKPAAHFWTQSAPPYHHFDPGVPQFTKGADSEPLKKA